MNDEIFLHDKVVIIGYPKTGKTTLLNSIKEEALSKGYLVLFTDKFIELCGFEKGLYLLMHNLTGVEKYIVEGVLGVRLLRKTTELEFNSMKPDLIVHCLNTHLNRKKYIGARNSFDSILKKYRAIEKNPPKKIIHLI